VFAKFVKMRLTVRHIFKKTSIFIIFLDVLTIHAIIAFYFDFSEVRE